MSRRPDPSDDAVPSDAPEQTDPSVGKPAEAVPGTLAESPVEASAGASTDDSAESSAETSRRDLVLPAIGNETPPRLIIFLHGAGSSPQSIIPLALAWQIKFQSALVALPQAPYGNAHGGFSWIDPHCTPPTTADIDAAVDALLPRIDALARTLGISPERTVIVGLIQGASLALELAFRHPSRCGVVVTYGSRLYRVPQDGDTVGPAVRMVHGELDSVVPADYARAALRRMSAVGGDVTLDLLNDEGNAIGQVMINAGTQRLMDTLFGERLRTRQHGGRLH